MTEQAYQTKIMKKWEAIGGHVVNGQYTKAGEPDLQGGFPVEYMSSGDKCFDVNLLYLAVEVKTEKAYLALEKKWKLITVDGVEQYQLDSKFNGRELLQAAKINSIRRKGGLALFAWSFEQVEQYVKDNT